MKLIVDTHAFLWWLMDQPKLLPSALIEMQNRNNDVFVSSAVIWEIAIKQSLGKIQIPPDLIDVVRKSGFEFLLISEVHALATQRLPLIHKDPFDRMLVAQALIENATIVTSDAYSPQYGVNCLGA
jgi:PIN domain nuclease of toxin-antitoxin system